MYRYKNCQKCCGTGKEIDDARTGKNILEARRERKLTLREMSERIGWSIGYISDLEHGRKRWNEKKMTKYVQALELPRST